MSLEVRKDALADQVFRQGRRLRAGMLAEKLADHLVELTAVEEIAAAQVPHKPFTSSKVGRHHNEILRKRWFSAELCSALCTKTGATAGDVAWQEPRAEDETRTHAIRVLSKVSLGHKNPPVN